MKKTIIWTSYHIEDIPNRYNLKESDTLKLFCTTNLSLKNDNINHLNKYLGELCTMYYVWKNNIKSNYVGFQHYRMLLKNINTKKLILFDNAWNGPVLNHFYNAGIQTHMIYSAIEYLSKKLGISSIEITNMMTLNTICSSANVFVLKWDVFVDLCEFIFGFFDYLFPNQSWKDESTFFEYINSLNHLFVNNEYIKEDNNYYGQKLEYNNYRYVIYFFEFFIPFYLNVKYNKCTTDENFPNDNFDANSIMLNWSYKSILCDLNDQNVSIENFKKWYELNNCAGIENFYILNYENSEIYDMYKTNKYFYYTFKNVKFVDNENLQNIINLNNKDNIYKINIDEYIDTISYEFYMQNKYTIKKI